MSHLRDRARKCFYPPNEIRILSVEDADRGRDHAAATLLSKRTRGSKMWNAVPFFTSLSTSI